MITLSNYERYDYTTQEGYFAFKFESVGRNGIIKKLVEYVQLGEFELGKIYNLGFGDYNEETGEVDDKIVSDNGDMTKVLATVAATLYVFTEHYPDAIVYAEGSSKSRTRLYRWNIAKNLEELKQDFYVFGVIRNIGYEEFIKDKNYDGFFVKRK